MAKKQSIVPPEKVRPVYTPEFAEKLRQGETDIAKGAAIRLNPDNLWQNIL